MQSGKKHGMQTMNDALYNLYMTKQVTFDECARASHDPIELMRMCGISNEADGAGTPGRPSPATAGAKR